MSRAAGGEAGFTLLELLVVVVLAGLGLVLVAPRLGPRANSLERAAAEAARALSESRERAIDRARIETIFGSAPLPWGEHGVVLESEGQVSIRFFPDGTASGGTVAVVDESGRRIRLRIDPLTGRIVRVRN
ncbi:MAG: prepilin-type N-terminal cleavage/methylation domain-containing protein [Geminicoccaceae bacterium]|nr:prepilin-type N-terminal cleavage/methylation domain-containing protein [Geminicoccaceae bacterium]